uniref:Putative ovule protein n=1 Tax=Solanum chacoense TaxID=4108 RepID=A0A0V0GNK9_SOLCH
MKIPTPFSCCNNKPQIITAGSLKKWQAHCVALTSISESRGFLSPCFLSLQNLTSIFLFIPRHTKA